MNVSNEKDCILFFDPETNQMEKIRDCDTINAEKYNLTKQWIEFRENKGYNHVKSKSLVWKLLFGGFTLATMGVTVVSYYQMNYWNVTNGRKVTSAAADTVHHQRGFHRHHRDNQPHIDLTGQTQEQLKQDLDDAKEKIKGFASDGVLTRPEMQELRKLRPEMREEARHIHDPEIRGEMKNLRDLVRPMVKQFREEHGSHRRR